MHYIVLNLQVLLDLLKINHSNQPMGLIMSKEWGKLSMVLSNLSFFFCFWRLGKAAHLIPIADLHCFFHWVKWINEHYNTEHCHTLWHFFLSLPFYHLVFKELKIDFVETQPSYAVSLVAACGVQILYNLSFYFLSCLLYYYYYCFCHCFPLLWKNLNMLVMHKFNL